MKKLLLPLMLIMMFALAACGGGEVVDQARATAEGVVQDVSDAAENAIDTVAGDESDTAVPCNLADIPAATQADVTVRFVNNTDGQVAIIWRDVEQSPPALTEYIVLATGESYDQETFIGHEWIAEDQAGNGVVEYTATSDATQCLVIEADALVMVPTEGPAGETVTVDPTQPIEVEDSNGTQISVGANELVDENGNPATEDLNVNMYTPDEADEEGSTSCEEPDTSDVLTVWSYNPDTGLWEEEGLVAYNPETRTYDLPVEEAVQDESCDASVASVTVEVTDDAGNEYDLADGAEAEVSVPCEPKPDEVLTVWSYNPDTGLWEEEGSATIEGETCSAEVSNLSNVNFVAQDPVSGMQGQVVDLGSGEALTGAQVCIQGSDQCATVDDNGNYSLSDLDPAEFVFEVSATDYITATQTLSLAAGETLTQDFALTATNPVLAVLPDEVVLRGVVVAIGTTTNLLDEATIAVGDTFQFLETGLSINLPDYNISANVPILVADVSDRGGNGYSELVVAIPNRSKSEIGQQANAAIENLILTIKTAGEANELVKTDDLMEVVLSDPTSTALPYTVNFYRGEARELVATFTINNQ